MNYYNDNDRFCCQWLRNLIDAKLIPQGVVDDRSISDIRPSELREFRQLHFFAGIGGWAYALRLAGWPDDRPVVTGSCPCQPFSVAGKGKGVADERHLWPAFRWLIAHLRPATVFGEQVASKAGRLWLAGVRTDLEELGYAVGAADLCAAGVGAPHIRQRLFWVAEFQDRNGRTGERRTQEGVGANGERRRGSAIGCVDCWVGITPEVRPQVRDYQDGELHWSRFDEAGGDDFRMGNTASSGWGKEREDAARGFERSQQEGCLQRPWDDSRLIHCADGKTRRIPLESSFQSILDGIPAFLGDDWLQGCSLTESQIRKLQECAAKITEGMTTQFPLCGTVPGRVGLLKGAGNAIVPQLAAEFINAFMEVENG